VKRESIVVNFKVEQPPEESKHAYNWQQEVVHGNAHLGYWLTDQHEIDFSLLDLQMCKFTNQLDLVDIYDFDRMTYMMIDVQAPLLSRRRPNEYCELITGFNDTKLMYSLYKPNQEVKETAKVPFSLQILGVKDTSRYEIMF
jgi:hypothetical protein